LLFQQMCPCMCMPLMEKFKKKKIHCVYVRPSVSPAKPGASPACCSKYKNGEIRHPAGPLFASTKKTCTAHHSRMIIYSTLGL
jgi:hypothetical protein